MWICYGGVIFQLKIFYSAVDLVESKLRLFYEVPYIVENFVIIYVALTLQVEGVSGALLYSYIISGV